MAKNVNYVPGTCFTFSRRGFLLGAASLVLSGCGANNSGDSASGDTVTVTDYAGRTVAVPTSPTRIAALDSFSGELMVMCGAGPQLCATPTGVTTDALLQQLYPDLTSVSAPMASGAINMEELAATNPQVALVKQSIYETSGQREQLDALSFPYVVVGYASIDEQIAAMELVGQVCGGDAQPKAQSLADFYRQVVEEVTARAASLEDADRVRVYHAINALTATDGAASLGADWITRTGCVDVSASDATATPATGADVTTNLEQIYTWDPDAIVCNSANSTKYLYEKDACAALRAVRQKRCYTIPVGATRWGQVGSVETYLAMLWLGCTVYPKLYKDVDLQDRVTSYYRDYLGIEVDDTLYQQILSGEGLRQASKQQAGG